VPLDVAQRTLKYLFCFLCESFASDLGLPRVYDMIFVTEVCFPLVCRSSFAAPVLRFFGGGMVDDTKSLSF
jgi:hypothetical protein